MEKLGYMERKWGNGDEYGGTKLIETYRLLVVQRSMCASKSFCNLPLGTVQNLSQKIQDVQRRLPKEGLYMRPHRDRF